VPPVNGAKRNRGSSRHRLAHVGDDVILHRAARFHRLGHQETLLQFLDVERIGIEMFRLQGAEARPQALLALAFSG